MTLENDEDTHASCNLSEVILLNEQLGFGSYGRVYTVEHRGTKCAAKKIHSWLLENIESEEILQKVKNDFIKECYHCSNLIHPNIVQCFGVYYPDQQSFPVKVSEFMDINLTSFVEKANINYFTKISVLNDVAMGLCFLHSRNPPIAHCNLFPNNILLKYNARDETLPVAKIADLGVAKVIQAYSKHDSVLLSEIPQSFFYLPPESFYPAYSSTSSGTQTDIFSFGAITLFIFNAVVPGARHATQISEAEYYRQKCLDMLIGESSSLKAVAECCLDNRPECRPLIASVSETLNRLMVCTFVSVYL